MTRRISRILSVLLAFVMIAVALPITASAADTGTTETYYIPYTGNQTYYNLNSYLSLTDAQKAGYTNITWTCTGAVAMSPLGAVYIINYGTGYAYATGIKTGSSAPETIKTVILNIIDPSSYPNMPGFPGNTGSQNGITITSPSETYYSGTSYSFNCYAYYTPTGIYVPGTTTFTWSIPNQTATASITSAGLLTVSSAGMVTVRATLGNTGYYADKTIYFGSSYPGTTYPGIPFPGTGPVTGPVYPGYQYYNPFIHTKTSDCADNCSTCRALKSFLTTYYPFVTWDGSKFWTNTSGTAVELTDFWNVITAKLSGDTSNSTVPSTGNMSWSQIYALMQKHPGVKFVVANDAYGNYYISSVIGTPLAQHVLCANDSGCITCGTCNCGNPKPITGTNTGSTGGSGSSTQNPSTSTPTKPQTNVSSKIKEPKLNGIIYGTSKPNIISVVTEFPFTDVKTNDWYMYAAYYVYTKGYMSFENGVFGANTSVSRIDLIEALAALAGIKAEDHELKANLRDVKATEDSAPFVQWALENKLLSKYAKNNFYPNRNITREEFAFAIYTFNLKYKFKDMTKTYDLEQYTDAKKCSNANYQKAMAWALENGFLAAAGNKLDPKGAVGNAILANALYTLGSK